MKVIMYGSPICVDCVKAKEALSKMKDMELDYRCITESTTNLKEFLGYRDHEVIFDKVKEDGRIGIPFFVLEDGTKTFDLESFVDVEKLEYDSGETNVSACSIDGKGNC